MKTILVPFDFSKYAEAALDFATQICKKEGGQIKLLHVIEYQLATTFNVTDEVSTYDPMDKVFSLELIKKAKNDLNTIVCEYLELSIDPMVLMGHPSDGIIDQIEKLQVDLIVMGTKGAKGLQELLIGSNTEKIVRSANCPVIAIHQKRKLKDIKNIVVPSDLDDSQGKIIELFKEYQLLFDAKLHLVWVSTPYNTINENEAKEKLEVLAQKHDLDNYDVKTKKAFSPEEGILNYACEIDADMIALSTHSHKGIMHLLLGSVAEDIVNHANLPVWTCTIKNTDSHSQERSDSYSIQSHKSTLDTLVNQ